MFIINTKITKAENINTITTETNNEYIVEKIISLQTNTEIINKTNEITNMINDITKEKKDDDQKEENTLKQIMDNAPFNVPNDIPGCKSIAKTYMAYTAVTAKNSPQYKLLNDEKAHTDKATGLRMYEDRYCIALGSYYTSTIGTKVNLLLENVFKLSSLI